MPTKKCTRCGSRKPLALFNQDKRSSDGHECQCKQCRSEYHKRLRATRPDRAEYLAKQHSNQKRYEQTDKGRATRDRHNHSAKGKANQRKYHYSPKGQRRAKRSHANYYQRHPERVRAVNGIYKRIRRGKLPHPTTLPCHYCDKPAAQYHHHRGYDEAHRWDVIAVCCRCHVGQHYPSVIG